MLIVHGLSSSCKEGLPQALSTLYTHSQAANQKYLHMLLLLACGRYQQCYNIIRLEDPCVQDDCSHVAPCGVHGGLLSELSYQIMNEYFQEPYPARAAIGVRALPKGASVEMDGIVVI